MCRNLYLLLFFHGTFPVAMQSQVTTTSLAKAISTLSFDLQHHIVGFVLVNSINNWHPLQPYNRQHEKELLCTALSFARINPMFKASILMALVENPALIHYRLNTLKKQIMHAPKIHCQQAIDYQNVLDYLDEHKAALQKSFTTALQQGQHLITAVQKNQESQVEELFEEGAQANVCNKFGYGALHIAARLGNTKIGRLLLEHDADINAREKNSENTPLMEATQAHNPKFINLLLTYGADTTLINKHHQKASDFACTQKIKKLAKIEKHLITPKQKKYFSKIRNDHNRIKGFAGR